jgi:type I restriction enzyme S subunit
MLSLSYGTVFQTITIKTFQELKIPLPTIEEQQAIAKILSDLDEKIELNNKMNKTLEEIAQVIFKRWFIDFEFPNENGDPYKSSGGEMVESELGLIPRGWGAGILKDILNSVKTPLKAEKGLQDRVYVPIDLLPIKKIGLTSYLPYTEAKSSLIAFEKNDILVGAMRIYFHRVCLSPFAGITRTTAFVLRARNENFHAYSLFVLNQDSTIQYANSHSKGSTMPYAVWDGSLSDMRIVIPDETTLKKFNNLLRPILNKIRDTIFEHTTLSSIRDLLLPKLMTGKIRVPLED